MRKCKKLVALLLAVMLILSTVAVAFAASAEDEIPTSIVETTKADEGEEDHVEHKTFGQLIVMAWNEFISFLRYIFYDVYRGAPAPDIPEAPTKFEDSVAPEF